MEIQSYIAQKIRELRTEKLGITADTLASLLRPVKTGKAVCSWEKGRTKPNAEILAQLCRIFNEPITTFYPEEYSRKTRSDEDPYVEVSFYGSIAAGKPLSIIPIEDTRPLPVEMQKKFPRGFFLRVEGESMSNVLPNGSYAFIDPQQNDPVDNAAYAICMNYEDATIKRVRKLENGYTLLPDSKDPTFKPYVFDYADSDSNEITIFGRVVWMMLPFNWEI